MSGNPSSMRAAIGLYRLAVRICPRPLRPHTSDMVRDFAYALELAYRDRGWRGYAKYCVGALSDAFVVALAGRCTALGKLLLQTGRGPNSIRYALRSLSSSRLLSATAVCTIALGVGLTTTTFSIVYGVLLRPLPFPNADRLMAVELEDADSGRRIEFEALDLEDFRDRQTSFKGLDGYYRRRAILMDADGHARSLAAGVVTSSALDRLGVSPHLGRTFRPGEDFTDDIRHVVLGYNVWRQRYGADPNALGTSIRVDGRELEIIGVMPVGFEFPVAEELWLPMDFDLPSDDRGSGHSFDVFAQLDEGVDIEAARAEAETIAARIAAENADVHHYRLSASVYPFADRYLPGGIAAMLHVMLAAVFGVLFIACANVANLLLARSMTRIHEVSIRRALGAHRHQVVGQFLLESVALSMAGSLLGLGLTMVGVEMIGRRLPSGLSLPHWVDISIAPPVLGLTAGLIVFVALAAGVVPAMRATRTDAGVALGDGTRGSTGRQRGMSVLVTAQIALSCALLIGCGLLVKSLTHLRTLDLGYDAGRVLAVDLRLPSPEYATPDAATAAFAEIRERVTGLQSVQHASLARDRPGTGPTFSWDFEVRGETYTDDAYPTADGVPVSNDYLRTMGIELVRGRDFTATESRFGGEPALIVNATLARRHLGPDPIGRQIRIGPGDEGSPWLTVVGVAGDAFIGSSTGGIGMDESPREQAYISWGVAPYSRATLLLSSRRDPEQLVPEVREVLRQVVPGIPMDDAAKLSDVIEDSTWSFGLFGTVFAVFGGLAYLMAAVGLYGVMASGVIRRRPEMSVRKALGAGAGSIVGLVLREAGRHLLSGLALGLAVGVLLASSIRAALFGVSVVDVTVYAAVVVAIVATGLAATLLPAFRAGRTDPMRSLRP